jgi:hypothetical protein
MLEDLQNIALTLHIDPVQSVGHAAKLNTILKVLSEFNKSYYNYLEVEFLKKDKFRSYYEKNNKVLDTLKEDLDLLAVDVKFSSFQISVAPNIISPQISMFNEEVGVWKKETFDNYKENIVKGDFQDISYINKILSRYDDLERNKIFHPLFSIMSNSKEYKVNILNNDGAVEKVLLPPDKEKLLIYIPKIKLASSIAEEKTVMAYMKVKQTEGTVDIKKNNIKKILYQEVVEHDIYPFRPETIVFDNKIILLQNKLNCDIEFSDNSYYIIYEPFNISVWGDTRDEAETAFNFSFYALYENYVLEEDSALSASAIILKSKLIKSIKKVVNES